ncbi:hypothetical protein ACNI65_06530 [Roseateles sp. So40a]|uniref:hypothetical protein n=1 Tax=Roseateles sp. So40a TaxID=3400226 RepID=UPI003A8AB77C
MRKLTLDLTARSQLAKEFARLKRDHTKALQSNAARVILGSSVVRVFAKGSKADMLSLLSTISLASLRSVESEADFKQWFVEHTATLERCLAEKNANNERVHPGLRWGHCTKVLALFARQIVNSPGLFDQAALSKIEPWLYVPVDSIVMNRLRQCGVRPSFSRIKEISTAEEFFEVQNLLGEVASGAGVPRIWFDDNWGHRNREGELMAA